MIKSTQQSGASTELSYPKLMECSDTGVVVLFTQAGCGTVVSHSFYWGLGHFMDIWATSSFVDYNGKITLENIND